MILLANSDGLAVRFSSSAGDVTRSTFASVLLRMAVSPGGLTPFRALAVVAVLLLSSAAPARAEWQFTPFIGYTFKATSTFVDFDFDEDSVATDETRFNFGGAVRLIGDSPIGVEAYYVHTPGFFNPKSQFGIALPLVLESRTYALMGNVVLATPQLESLRLAAVAVGRHRHSCTRRSTIASGHPLPRGVLGMTSAAVRSASFRGVGRAIRPALLQESSGRLARKTWRFSRDRGRARANSLTGPSASASSSRSSRHLTRAVRCATPITRYEYS